MNRPFGAICAVAALALLASTASAKGCITGAAVGGAAGHLAGHHAVVGAVAGCAINHRRNAVKDKEAAAAAARPLRPVDPALAAPQATVLPATTPKQVAKA